MCFQDMDIAFLGNPLKMMIQYGPEADIIVQTEYCESRLHCNLFGS
jgi:hypothetical protein